MLVLSCLAPIPGPTGNLHTDYDLLIITSQTFSPQEKIRWSTRLDRAIVDAIKAPVDLLLNSDEEIRQKKEPPGHIIRSAIREGVLYDPCPQIEPMILDNACFHCQQAIENCLKAFLIYRCCDIERTLMSFFYWPNAQTSIPYLPVSTRHNCSRRFLQNTTIAAARFGQFPWH